MAEEERHLNADGGRTGDAPNDRSSAVAPTIDVRIIEMDEIFDLLSHARRRYVLFALADAEQVSLDGLATALAAWEAGREASAVTAVESSRVFASLRHLHVPLLAEADVVEFDEVEEALSWGLHGETAIAVLEGVSARLDGPDSVRSEGE